MGDLDYQAIARALNQVRTNAQAVAGADVALAHADQALTAAGGLSDYEFLAGSAARAPTVRRVTDARTAVERARGPLDGTYSAAVNAEAWDRLRKAMGLLYVEIAGVYGVLQQDSVVDSMVSDLATSIAAYGDQLAAEGVLGGAGKVIGDVAQALGHGAANVVKGVGAGAKDVAGAASGGILGLLKSLWPVLLIVGVVLIVGFVGKRRLGL